MFNIIIYGILGVLLILLIAQVIVFYKVIKGKSPKDVIEYEKFSEEVNHLGDRMMGEVTSGTIKKQLLTNDAPTYDSRKTMEKYKEFVEGSSLYKRISNIGESRYH